MRNFKGISLHEAEHIVKLSNLYLNLIIKILIVVLFVFLFPWLNFCSFLFGFLLCFPSSRMVEGQIRVYAAWCTALHVSNTSLLQNLTKSTANFEITTNDVESFISTFF